MTYRVEEVSQFDKEITVADFPSIFVAIRTLVYRLTYETVVTEPAQLQTLE